LTVAFLVIIFAFPFYRKIKSFRLQEIESKSQGFDKKLFSKMSRFAFPNLLTAIAGTFIGYIDTLILTYMVSLSMVGVYNAVLPTVLILSQFGGVIATVFFPMLSELWAKKDYSRMQHGISMIYRYCLLLTLPFSFAALFFATPILRILFGTSFVIGANALRILSLGMIFLTLAQVNFSVLNGIGKPKEVTKIVVFAAVFNTVLNLVLIPLMGINGAALTTTLSYFIMLAWSYVSMRKKVQFKAEKSLSIVISSFVFLGLLYLFRRIFSLTQPGMSLYLEAAISLAVSFIVYAALVFLLKCITFSEIKRIVRNAMRLRSYSPGSVPPKD
jgi:O-antigen/teichoic acid export membrane protein